MKQQEKAYGWMRSLLCGWGLSECWAKVIAGMVIGALAAAGLLSSCAVAYKQHAGGEREFYGTIVHPAEVTPSK